MEGPEKDLTNLSSAVGEGKESREETMMLPDERIKYLEEKVAKLKIKAAAYEELLEQVDELSRDAFYDKLTGLKSRAFFVEEMKYVLRGVFGRDTSKESRVSDESNGDVCVTLFDIDKFKSVNDTLGHMAGDEVLKIVAQTIQDSVRDTDIAARWGGEEMVLVLEDTNIQEAVKKANEIREKISKIKFKNHPELSVTISAGVAAASDFDNEEDFFKAADKAMYDSKNTGRNRVTTYSKENIKA